VLLEKKKRENCLAIFFEISRDNRPTNVSLLYELPPYMAYFSFSLTANVEGVCLKKKEEKEKEKK